MLGQCNTRSGPHALGALRSTRSGFLPEVENLLRKTQSQRAARALILFFFFFPLNQVPNSYLGQASPLLFSQWDAMVSPSLRTTRGRCHGVTRNSGREKQWNPSSRIRSTTRSTFGGTRAKSLWLQFPSPIPYIYIYLRYIFIIIANTSCSPNVQRPAAELQEMVFLLLMAAWYGDVSTSQHIWARLPLC